MDHKKELWKRLTKLDWNVMLAHFDHADNGKPYRIIRMIPRSKYVAKQQEIIGWGKTPEEAVANMIVQEDRGTGE